MHAFVPRPNTPPARPSAELPGPAAAPSANPAAGRAPSVEGDAWERDADRRARDALARQKLAATPRAPLPRGALPAPVRETMEGAFKHHFGKVRVFADDAGAAAADRVAARAVTVDRDIFFARGEYGPELLAHELAHVVQRDLGAPQLAYRNAADVRRVQRALRNATGRLGRAVRFLPTPEARELVNSIASVMAAFIPTGHGLIDAAGATTRPSQAVFLDQPVRHGGTRGTYRHTLRLYLSEERPGAQARYQPDATGGEIRVFVPEVVSLPDEELIATLVHELVHVFTDVLARAERFGRRMRGPQAPAAPQPALPGATGTGRPVSVSIALADSTLGHDQQFETLVTALHHTYEPVVDFLNQRRVARGAATLDRVATSAVWAGRTADELLAYIVDEQVNIALQLEAGTGRARVAFVIPLDPVRFFISYASLHWLNDPQDRAALRLPAAEPILRRAGSSPALRAVYSAIERWVMHSASAPGAGRPTP